MATFDPDLRAAIKKAVADINAFYGELNGESARAAAILAIASLDNELTRIIRRIFADDLAQDVWRRVAGPGAPLGDLKHRTNFVEALGHFGPKTRVAIERMAVIRNKFAHHPDVRSFSHPEVLKHCQSLGGNPVNPYELGPNATESDIRSCFVDTVRALHERLEHIAEHVSETDAPLPRLP
jgi:hypothetical protein